MNPPARQPGRIPVTLVVLTFNEELNLPACLGSVGDLVDEMFVVDSGSTDTTIAIADVAGATVVTHDFETHALQWSWALSSLPISNDWVLGLDADQRFTSELVDELREVFLKQPSQLDKLDGFYLNRRQMFRGRWIRHGGYYPKFLLKLFRKDAVRLDPSERVDHHFYVTRAARLRHDLIEENKKEDAIGFWLQKHLRYASLLAAESANREGHHHEPLFRGWRDPASRMKLLKGGWNRLPLYWRGFAFFIYRYLIRLGFLDGREGFIFHFLQTCWFRLVVDVMIQERRDACSAEPEGGR